MSVIKEQGRLICTTRQTLPSLSSIVIRKSEGWDLFTFKEVWIYRELFYFLAWRNIKVRYKQTILGVGWALIQPLATMLIFTIFFGRLANMPSDGIPYSLFALSGLVPWTFFSNAVTLSGGSLVSDANLIKKIYFPRLIIPFSCICSGLFDFMFTFTMFLAVMPFYGIFPGLNLCFLPLFMLILFASAAGVGLLLSTMNALFRDVHHLIPFGMQIWLFMTPIVYPASLLSPKWKLLLSFNPMVGIVELYRWMMLGTPLSLSTVFISSSVTVILLIAGIMFFRKMESQFADII